MKLTLWIVRNSKTGELWSRGSSPGVVSFYREERHAKATATSENKPVLIRVDAPETRWGYRYDRRARTHEKDGIWEVLPASLDLP